MTGPGAPGVVPSSEALEVKSTPRLVHTFGMASTLTINCEGRLFWGVTLDSAGQAISEKVRLPPPYPLSPTGFVAAISNLAGRLPRAARATVGMPDVVRRGSIVTAPHYVYSGGPRSKADPDVVHSWLGLDVEAAVTEALRIPARVVNDAEVRGAASISGLGLEVMLVLGTGLGCAVYDEGRCLPYLDISKTPIRKGVTYNDWLGDKARRRLGNRRWSKRVERSVADLEPSLLWDHLYLGGRNAAHLTMDLGSRGTTVPEEVAITGGARLWLLEERARRDAHEGS